MYVFFSIYFLRKLRIKYLICRSVFFFITSEEQVWAYPYQMSGNIVCKNHLKDFEMEVHGTHGFVKGLQVMNIRFLATKTVELKQSFTIYLVCFYSDLRWRSGWPKFSIEANPLWLIENWLFQVILNWLLWVLIMWKPTLCCSQPFARERYSKLSKKFSPAYN